MSKLAEVITMVLTQIPFIPVCVVPFTNKISNLWTCSITIVTNMLHGLYEILTHPLIHQIAVFSVLRLAL